MPERPFRTNDTSATRFTDPIHYEINRSYTARGQSESVHPVSAVGEAVELDYKID